MKFLTNNDLNQLIKSDNLNQIINSDESLLDDVEAMSLAEVKAYSSKQFDMEYELRELYEFDDLTVV